MTNGEENIDFETLEHLLLMASTPFSPAYIHGFMAGMLCMGDCSPQKCWGRLQVEIPYLGEKGAGGELFRKLFILTASKLQDLEVNFCLLLPDDDCPLLHRLSALAECCEGFLEGVKLVSKSTDKLLRYATVKEILEDFEQISQISVQSLESGENEKAYTELVEFVRVSILLVYAEVFDINTVAVNQIAEYHFSGQVH